MMIQSSFPFATKAIRNILGVLELLGFFFFFDNFKCSLKKKVKIYLILNLVGLTKE